VLAALGIFGASLFLGDSMITPAISVLSAVEGLKVPAPSLEHLIVPITATIIVALFMLQRVGTATVGRLFGRVMLVWFLTIAASGVHGIADHRRSSKRCHRPTRWTSSSTTSRSRSSRWPPSCSR
jgi:KUP system potassium uptake protein